MHVAQSLHSLTFISFESSSKSIGAEDISLALVSQRFHSMRRNSIQDWRLHTKQAINWGKGGRKGGGKEQPETKRIAKWMAKLLRYDGYEGLCLLKLLKINC